MSPAPDWLAKRDGRLEAGLRDFTTVVMLGGQPQYRLEVRPAAGTFACTVVESVNGRLVPGGDAYPDPAAAVAGGLDRLRAHLGW